jgi:myosin-3
MLLSKPRGVLATLDEESRFPKATDVTFTNKVSAQLATHASESFKPPPSNRDMHFSVRHYAGMVKYSTDGFLTKNRDALSQPVVNTMKFSEDPLIGSLWKARKTGTGTFRTMRGDRVTVKRKAPTTVGSQFVNSLEDLMRRIQESTPHFIRCLKPNAQKKPSCWNESLVEKQLMYAGVLETVRIRKMGYSVREVFSEFVNRYAPIAFAGGSNPDPSRETCEKIMAAVGVTDFVFGKEKVFMK